MSAPRQADFVYREAGICPSCGGVTTVDPDAFVSAEYLEIYPMRNHPPTTKWVPCVIEHCTSCEWTEERRRGLAARVLP